VCGTDRKRIYGYDTVFLYASEEIRREKIQFILDDFGTGYSNLRCLSDLKPAYIKIDRSFTLKALNREYEYRLLNHIVEMSHSLGLHVCVEGIETEGELTKAKQTEPDYIQGFLFGKPCSRAEFTQKFFTKQAG
jgi:EAL domain-containing protein (putative c-di-GMP-specific phosphodiesterase class I)